MSVPEPRKSTVPCGCGCNRMVSQLTKWHHEKERPPTSIVQLESPPSPKRRRITHFQSSQESSIIRSDEQKQSCTDCNSSISHSYINVSSASDHPTPQLRVPSFNSNTSISKNLPVKFRDICLYMLKYAQIWKILLHLMVWRICFILKVPY